MINSKQINIKKSSWYLELMFVIPGTGKVKAADVSGCLKQFHPVYLR